MPKRAAYYRTEAEKCLWHAERVDAAEIQAELRRLAIEYIERAALAESAKANDKWGAPQ
jgi:hypothetical protein